MEMEIWLTGNGELFLGVNKCGSLDDWKWKNCYLGQWMCEAQMTGNERIAIWVNGWVVFRWLEMKKIAIWVNGWVVFRWLELKNCYLSQWISSDLDKELIWEWAITCKKYNLFIYARPLDKRITIVYHQDYESHWDSYIEVIYGRLWREQVTDRADTQKAAGWWEARRWLTANTSRSFTLKSDERSSTIDMDSRSDRE